MNLHTEIEHLTKKFSFDWYQKKQTEFRNPLKGYQLSTNTRVKKVAGFNTNVDEETGESYSELAWEDIEETTIEEYCWFNEDYPDNGQIVRIGIQTYAVDASIVITELCNNLDDFLPKESLDASFNIVNTAISILRENILKLSSDHKDEAYSKVCEFLINKTAFYMRMHFEKIINAYLWNDQGFPKLEFDLNKQELSALIFLLIEAGFVSKKERGLIGKYEFFEKYFYWTDPSNNTKYQLGDLRRIISKFSKGERSKSVDDIMKKVKNAYDNYLD